MVKTPSLMNKGLRPGGFDLELRCNGTCVEAPSLTNKGLRLYLDTILVL
ncbi:hypothetical protein ACFL6I_08560 [candidate division KSB1 bacterium]